MSSNNEIFVSFKPQNDHFVGFVSIEVASNNVLDPENLVKHCTKIYNQSIAKMRQKFDEINSYKNINKPIPARKVWELGNLIFKMQNRFQNENVSLDGVYDHLERDLNVRRKWLVKVIILRRYIPNSTIIPISTSWGYFDKSTRKKALELTKE